MATSNAGNGLAIADGSADLEIYDGFGTWGFRMAALSPLTEKRGDGFAGQVASGGQNYDDATPFKRKVYDNFLGGMGQVSDNKVSGGVGIGGDDTKYFYADAMTDRAGYVLPGMARNQLINPHTLGFWNGQAGQVYNHYQEDETPRGLLPCTLSSHYYIRTMLFTAPGNPLTGITSIRILLNLRNASSSVSNTITCMVWQSGVQVATYTATFTPTTLAPTSNGWAWFTLTGSAFTFTAPVSGFREYDLYFYDNSIINTGPISAIGCYVGDLSNQAGAKPNLLGIRPYFQICKAGTATPYTWWSGALRKVHQVLNGSVYINVAVLSTAWFNVAALSTGGTISANSPEVTLTGVWTGSLVLNNKLYIATTNNLSAWTPGLLAVNSNAAPTNGPDVGGLGISSLVAGYGNIYFVTNGGLGISKWNGTFPFAATVVVAPGTIGDPGTAITRIFFYQGNLWAAKPEGLFLLYADPQLMGSSVTYTPRITPMGDPFPTPHQAAGAYTVIHQGTIYTNYKDRLYAVTVSATGTQVQIIPLPMPWYRLGYYHQIDGITSDGVNLYVSYNNLGVFKYINQVWHPVTEFYETISSEPTNSGLTWVANPTQGTDNLYFRDSFSLVQIPIPNPGSPYTRQFTLADQNKCGYIITSGTNMEAAALKKYIFSVVLTALPADYCFLIRPVLYVPGWSATTTDPNTGFINLLTASFHDGLIRDSWMTPTLYATNAPPQDVLVTTTKVTPLLGTPIANSIAPCFWTAEDFSTGIYSVEKPTYAINNNLAQPLQEALTDPAVFTQTAFIIYFFNPVSGQWTQTGRDIMAIDSVDVKYQSIQDMLALYKVALDLNQLTENRGNKGLSGAEAETTWEFLRAQLGRHSPVMVTVKVRENIDPSPPVAPAGYPNYPVPPNVPTRSFLGFIQNPTDEYGQPLIVKDSGRALPTRVDFDIVSATGEYPNV